MSSTSAPVSFWTPVRLLFSRGLVILAMVVLLVSGAITMLQRGAQWRGDLIWTIDWISVSFVMSGPVLAALVAVDTARFSAGAEHLAAQRWVRTPATGVLLAYSVAVGVTHVIALLASLVISLPPVGDPWAWLAVLVQLAVLVLFMAIGSLAGRLVTPVLAGLVGGLSVLVAVYFLGTPRRGLSLLDTGMATAPRVGWEYSGAYLGAQLLVITLVIVAVTALRPVEPLKPRSIRRRDALVSFGCVLISATLLFSVPVQRLKPSGQAPTWCGGVFEVRTCFYPQHARVAEGFQDRLWGLVDAARQAGYSGLVPRVVHEASQTRIPSEPGVAAIYVRADHLGGSVPTYTDVVFGLVEPVHCRQLAREEPPSERYLQDLSALAATWIGLVDPEEASSLGVSGAAMPASEAVELLNKFRTCTYEHF